MNGRSPNSATAVRVTARLPATRAGEPLQGILLEQHVGGELAARTIDRGRLAPLERLRPFHPRPFLLAPVQRAKQAV
jgi:hypothetical protein